ncbi:MAG: hypothetical protein C0404_01225 [Verrucomicrobia bacterium]|nr:hypothetical protein [Verrucomicrobiota bacterium]
MKYCVESLAPDLLRKGRGVVIRVTGRSMLPFISPGDAISVAPAIPDKLRPGDIVLIQLKSGRLLAHRIVKLSRTKEITCIEVRGDAGYDQLEQFTPDRILGKVTGIIKPGGEVRLDRGIRHVAGAIWARTQPVGQKAMRLARKFKAAVSTPRRK